MNLEAKYNSLPRPHAWYLSTSKDEVAWRQDYPLIEGGPFKLEELEAAIKGFSEMDFSVS